MNIFFLSLVIKKCARYHFDKHVVKMIIELCQLLSTAWWIIHPLSANIHTVQNNIYRKTHVNHPLAIWVRLHINNYMYTVNLGLELCKEWRYRFNHPKDKLHGCENKLIFLLNNSPPNIPKNVIKITKHNPLGFILPIPQCMPPECKYKPEKLSALVTIKAYRNYYMSEHKSHLVKWTVKYTDDNNKKVPLSSLKSKDIDPPFWWGK